MPSRGGVEPCTRDSPTLNSWSGLGELRMVFRERAGAFPRSRTAVVTIRTMTDSSFGFIGADLCAGLPAAEARLWRQQREKWYRFRGQVKRL